ncbi:Mitogen-activated protein kinase kinase kinase [Trema orientale]|uniref:Mitogen-activated protein kinase kinase kinase n=1 Tax=Trema orientale TaxID=63057 RepID=A0A2P5E956_TREOI|nr:Mitogen-activated protein kinase kinase kinase [Trema orientale]
MAICISIYLLLLSATGNGDNTETQTPYNPTEYFLLDCGSSSDQTDSQGRLWESDSRSKRYYSSPNIEAASSGSTASEQESSNLQVPYQTARIFHHSKFTYSFPLSPGPKFLRLYFYSATYSGLDNSDSFFSVTANNFILLSNFSAYLVSSAMNPPLPYFVKEFVINVAENQKLINITFNPSPGSYAFINGIEVVSMPENLYMTYTDSKPITFVNNKAIPFFFTNDTALENVYRLNVGGRDVINVNDTGMFRTWSQDLIYIYGYAVGTNPYHPSVTIQYNNNTPAYTAPEVVYTTFRQMDRKGEDNTKYNLTWLFPVDSMFHYLVRLHFCETLDEITAENQRVFNIYINSMVAEQQVDVFHLSGGSKIPTYRDYIVFDENGSLKLELHPAVESKPKFYNAILNGAEIFKLNTSDGSLAGPNPDVKPPAAQNPKPELSQVLRNSKNNFSLLVKVTIIAGGVLLLVFLFILLRRRRTSPEPSSTKTKDSSLPSDLCRRFTIKEIRAATGDFDERRVIGHGGFGNVYRGDIDGVIVAVKRLNPTSKQGAKEFVTEIDMLSKLRHVHLVSLIGYCDDHGEMVLVYEYMLRGTLRDHLYKTDNPSLPWKRRLGICIGAAKGLHYLHTGAKHMIIHRDVKSTNILLDEKWVAKVSDFGLSRTGPITSSVTHVSTNVKGSFGYMDPEYYRRQQLTEKSDVYSFGVVLFEVLCARPAMARNLPKEEVGLAHWAQKCCRKGLVDQIMDPILKGEMVAAAGLKKFVELALSCVRDDGVERPSMKDVVGALEFALELQEGAEKLAINIGGLEITAVRPPFGQREGGGCLFSLDSSKRKSDVGNGSNTTVFSSGGGRVTSDSEV